MMVNISKHEIVYFFVHELEKTQIKPTALYFDISSESHSKDINSEHS